MFTFYLPSTIGKSGLAYLKLSFEHLSSKKSSIHVSFLAIIDEIHRYKQMNLMQIIAVLTNISLLVWSMNEL